MKQGYSMDSHIEGSDSERRISESRDNIDTPPQIDSRTLQIRGLSHIYPGGVQALNGVDLDIDCGLFGLVGPNGAGKTTLMRIVSTLEIPTAGSITFNKIDVLKTPLKLRRILGYLPQTFGVYRGICAEDLLNHLAVLKGVGPAGPRREQVKNLLELTNLYDVRKQMVANYSGGMLRRFGIAQALLGAPQLIIVDEPTAGLDPTERARFLDLLYEIGEDTAVILSTHILDEVEKICPKLAILLDGRVIASGDQREMVDKLSGRIWRKVMSRAEAAEIRHSLRMLSTRLAEGQLIVHVLSDNAPGDGFEPVDGNLHDVYFALTALDGGW